MLNAADRSRSKRTDERAAALAARRVTTKRAVPLECALLKPD